MIQQPHSSGKPPVVALICGDVVGNNMAGPGIRYWEFARALGQHTPVKLIIPPYVPMKETPSGETLPASIHVCSRVDELRSLAKECDVIVTLDIVLFFYPFLAQLGKPLVLDMYAPFLLEGLQEKADGELLNRVVTFENNLDALRIQLHSGDFFICASERQKDYVLGMLSAVGRVNPYTYQDDRNLDRLLDIVPFGIPTRPARHTRQVLKGVYKTIAADDPLLIWTGGIWNWFDAPTLIRAMPRILQHHPRTKLFFMGINRPNSNIKRMAAVDKTIALSQELGLYEQAVFFNDWVPYEERHNYLLEADIGVSLHLEHLETRFSFRTRMLDHLWTGLPTVSTKGDAVSETLAAEGLAYLVEPGDVEGAADTITRLLNNPTLRSDHAARFEQVAPRYQWEVITRPLVQFCTAPYIAPDKTFLKQYHKPDKPTNELVRILRRSWQAARLGGLSGLLRQGKEYIQWKISKYQKV